MVALGHWHGKCLQHMEKHNADCKILTKQKYFPTEHYIYACTHRHSEKLQTLYNYGCLSFLHVFFICKCTYAKVWRQCYFSKESSIFSLGHNEHQSSIHYWYFYVTLIKNISLSNKTVIYLCACYWSIKCLDVHGIIFLKILIIFSG